ncbi:alport syndrome [Flagelloscypha sp. PMI_526]|nr:alport syndrome [Flagelloscypha sp. PMI_526]
MSDCRPVHCFHAFDALYTALSGADPVPPTFPNEKCPLFVTWNTKPSRPGRAPRLRGCIGSFDALTLHDGLAEFALVSAFRDHRFRKIQLTELPHLQCVVSLLTDFEDASSYLDWDVGTHGIQISFNHPALLPQSESSTPSPFSSSSFLPRFTSSRQRFSACYLPDVIPEQGWTKIEAIDSAIAKAGWNGTISEDLRRSVKLRRYQSKLCSVDWEDYVDWRKQQTGLDLEIAGVAY